MAALHNQFLNDTQEDYVNDIQAAYKKKRRSGISKNKTVQMIIDLCKLKGIKPEEFIK